MSNLHNFNAGRKSWKMYAKELTSKDGDDLTIVPYDGKDLILEVSGNGNILFKEDGLTYNLADLSNAASSNVNLTNYDDASFGNVDISGNLKISNGNIDISHGIINFFATDEQLLGPDTGIAQKVQDLSNNLLISNNDASFNNVEINGTIKLPDSSNNGYGVSGEILTSRGSSNTPYWVAPTSGGGGGGMEYHHWGIDYVVYSPSAWGSGFFGKPINGVSYINYSQSNAAIGTSMSASNFNSANGHFTITTAGVYIIHIQILHAVFSGATSGYTDITLMTFPPSGGFDNQWSVFARGSDGYWQGANKQTHSTLHYTGYIPANTNLAFTFLHTDLNSANGPVAVNVLGENYYGHSSFIKFYKIG